MVIFVGNDDNLFAERMLEAGFYPENVPPVFSITNLHEASLKAFTASEYVTDKPTEGIRYNASKRGGQRRIFTMPNPVFMVDAAVFFTKHKNEIDEHLAFGTSSCSLPKFSPAEGRPIEIATFPEFQKRRRRDLAKSKYIVRTDISRFYHSIYTHALPWALHGKALAKKDRKPDSKTIFANRLDWILRQAQDGQTIGIPVGPDFSRVIAEIVACAIDKIFRQSLGPDIAVVRLVDDIYIGSDSLDEAHTYLGAMRDAIRTYELDINESKTSILSSSEDLEPYWPVEIRRELERYQGITLNKAQKRADLIHFLDQVLRQASELRDDGVIKFALRKIDEFQIWSGYWELLEPFLVRVAINFPHCLDYVARVVAWRNTVKTVDAELWRDVIHRSIRQNCAAGHESEITWSLWLLKELAQKLELEAFEQVIKKCGALPSLLALDIHKKQEPSYKIPKDLIVDKLGEQPMTGNNWLLAYEADRQFGFKIKSKNLQGNAFFKQLYDDDVSFYDQTAKPFVFKDTDDPESVKSAIESPISSYDDLYEDDDDPNDDDTIGF